MDNSDQRIEILEKKVDELQRSINKIKKIFYWAIVISVAMFVLPLIGLLFMIPQFLSVYGSALE